MTDNEEIIPLTIDASEFVEGSLKLLSILRPDWEQDKIHTKVNLKKILQIEL